MGTVVRSWFAIEASLDTYDWGVMAAALRRVLDERWPPRARADRRVEDVVRHLLRAQVRPHDEYVPGWSVVAFHDLARSLVAVARGGQGAWFDTLDTFGGDWASALEARARELPPEEAASAVVEYVVADARRVRQLLCDLQVTFAGLRLPNVGVAREAALAGGFRALCVLIGPLYPGAILWGDGDTIGTTVRWLLESQGFEPDDRRELAIDAALTESLLNGDEGGPARAAAVALRHEARERNL